MAGSSGQARARGELLVCSVNACPHAHGGTTTSVYPSHSQRTLRRSFAERIRCQQRCGVRDDALLGERAGRSRRARRRRLAWRARGDGPAHARVRACAGAYLTRTTRYLQAARVMLTHSAVAACCCNCFGDRRTRAAKRWSSCAPRMSRASRWAARRACRRRRTSWRSSRRQEAATSQACAHSAPLCRLASRGMLMHRVLSITQASY